ncbi:hypothetical protein EDD29_4454 [Actinocorallia herbida]|uniref:Uncharacterized protein n=1 Tax=Actinocorallia herbida TaxID=58109 RepID=A0A3N1D040_9ACTN|nr:hypothetical protein [Actinocorallia herbida]ROO86872.1 hypothetical protein EDD29_4454 [Actinocorallia herbida]
MKRTIMALSSLFSAALLVLGLAGPASAEVGIYKIGGWNTLQSSNNGLMFSVKSGQCSYEAKFTISAGGTTIGGAKQSSLWVYGHLLPGYPKTSSGKPNCRASMDIQLYNWTTDTFKTTNIVMVPVVYDTHQTTTFDVFTGMTLGDYADYQGWTLMGVTTSVEDLRLTALGTVNGTYGGKFYDIRMCEGGSKVRWDCGWWEKGSI